MDFLQSRTIPGDRGWDGIEESQTPKTKSWPAGICNLVGEMDRSTINHNTRQNELWALFMVKATGWESWRKEKPEVAGWMRTKMSKGRRVGKGHCWWLGFPRHRSKYERAQMNRDWQIVNMKGVWVKWRMLEWKEKLVRFWTPPLGLYRATCRSS